MQFQMSVNCLKRVKIFWKFDHVPTEYDKINIGILIKIKHSKYFVKLKSLNKK